MAAAIETGTQNNAVRDITQIVPYNADFKPALSGNLEGKLLRKFKFKVLIPFDRMSYNNMKSINTLMITAARHRILNIFAFNLRKV